MSAESLAGLRERNGARKAERLENVAWMVEGGENMTRAAARLGISFGALDRWTHKHCPELGRILRQREPHDPNQRPGVEAMRGKRWSA